VTEGSATESLVYQYGCPAWYDLPPQLVTGSWSVEEGYEGPQGPLGQLLLASRLWNRLVKVQQTHEKEKAAIWASVSKVAAAQAAHDVTQAALDASPGQDCRRPQARTPRSPAAGRAASRTRAMIMAAWKPLVKPIAEFSTSTGSQIGF
jgi:hypothetical protein